MSESCIEVLDSEFMDFPIIDISCIVLPYDISFMSIDISCVDLSCDVILPMDLSWNIIDNSCNSAVWYSLDVSFILMDISYALEKDRMVLFSHELSSSSPENS